MHFIDSLSLRTARVLESVLSDYSQIEAIFSKHKNKSTKFTQKDVIDTLTYSCKVVYGELFKIIILMLASYILKILLETFFVMISFLVSRIFIGGKHLNSSVKCLILTCILILGSSYLGSLLVHDFNQIGKVFVCVIFGVVLEVISITKWFGNLLEWIDRKV